MCRGKGGIEQIDYLGGLREMGFLSIGVMRGIFVAMVTFLFIYRVNTPFPRRGAMVTSLVSHVLNAYASGFGVCHA